MSSEIADIREAAVPPVLPPAPAGTGYVYRFAKISTGAYFYTGNDAERANIYANFPDFRPEGTGFLQTVSGPSAPVFRFANLNNGGYFYTGSEAERVATIRDYPNMRFEGSTFSVALPESAGSAPVYRLANLTNGAYLYTTSKGESDAAVAINGGRVWRAEGISFYAATGETAVVTTYRLTVGGVAIEEGQNAVFQLTLDKAPTAAVTVNYFTKAGTATTADFEAQSSSVTFAAGQATQFVTIKTIDDTQAESTETFTLELSGSALTASVSAAATIADTADNGGGATKYSLTVAPVTVEESATAVFELTLDKAPTAAVTVNFFTRAGTASTADFEAQASTVTFAVGQTKQFVNIRTTDDTIVETNEAFTLEISGTALTASVSAAATIADTADNAGAAGRTFTLTTGNDTMPGLIGSGGSASTTGDDTISAAIQNSGTNGATNESTLNSGDSLNAGSGTDQINIRVPSVTGAITVTPVLTSIEKVSISNIATTSSRVTLDLVSSTGVTSVEFKDTSVLSITAVVNAPPTASVILNNVDSVTDSHNVNLGSASGRSGAADAFALTISNGSGSAASPGGFNLVTPNGTTSDTSFEVANITVAGAASFVRPLSSFNTLTTVNVGGATTGVTTGFGLTLTQDSNFPALRTVDALSMSGGGLNIDARGSTASGFTFKGSAADDRVVLLNTTLNTAGALSGGEGKDTLALTSFNVTTSVVNGASGFEVLEVVRPEGSLNANTFTTINEFLFSGGKLNGRLNIGGVESNDRFVFSSDQGSSSESVRFTTVDVGNAVVFEMRASPETDGEVTIIAQENSQSSVGAIGFRGSPGRVTIDSTGQNAKPNVIEAVRTGSENYFAFNNEDGLSSFFVTGSQSLAISARVGLEQSSSARTAGFHNPVNLDASAFTAVLRVAGSSSNDVITGGSGDDIIYGLGGNDTLRGNGGSDQFRMFGSGGTDLLKDFVKGTDKIGFNNVDFRNTTASTDGQPLAATDYIANRSGITSIGSADNHKVIELQAALSTGQIQSDVGAAIEAYVLVFNSTTNKGQLWFDNDWSNESNRNQVATFDDVTDLAGVTGFTNTDFVEFIA